MKLALAQTNPRVGDIAKNLQQMSKQISRARDAGCELIIFPELSAIGYPPRDLLDFPHIIEENLAALKTVAALANGITVVGGYVEPNSNAVGKPFYNSAFVVRDGKQIANYRKQLLPYYDVFEEERYFEPGNTPCYFLAGERKVAISICEDLWNETGFIQRGYSQKPMEQLLAAKLDLLINISASPFNLGKVEKREALFTKLSERIKVPIAFCNQAGANDELIFDGSSMLASGSQVMARAKIFTEDLLICELGGAPSRVESRPGPTSQDAEAHWLTEALCLGIRDYVQKSNLKTVCIGLSGGIDSSVVAALAVRALGSENVFGVGLPTRFNSPDGIQDAQKLAQTLKISFQNISIDPLFEAFSALIKKELGGEPKALTLENIQPRLRMTLLMAMANDAGHLLLNTSNKSEIATGYATQYGDAAGALAVLGDLTKAQVYAVARFLNAENGVIISERVIARPPTAELRENQTDQDTLPPYDELDELVKRAIERSESPKDLSRGKIAASSIATFVRLNASSEYKRRQLPPALRISTHAFGMGRRIPTVGRKPTE